MKKTDKINSSENNSDEANEKFKNLSLLNLSYSHILNKKLLINRINYININTIDETNFYKYIYELIINIYITKINNFKVNIAKNFFNIIKIYPDGIYFFRAASKFFTNNGNNHKIFRNIVYNYIVENKNEYLINNNFVEYKGNVIDFEDFLDTIKGDHNFSGELEISAITKIFNISIYLFEINEHNNSYKLQFKNIAENIFMPYCLILLHVYINNNKNLEHFELIKINPHNFDFYLIKLLKFLFLKISLF